MPLANLKLFLGHDGHCAELNNWINPAGQSAIELDVKITADNGPVLFCATCYTLKRQDAEYFGGLREQVLERDGYACRVCGDPDPGVHHREPGKSLLHLMIALCAGCHAKVHRTKVVLTEFPPLLLVLWREQHPQGHEQTYIDFNVRKPPALSVPLNFEPARKD